MTLDPLKRIKWQIYLLELENYALARYSLLWPRFFQGPVGELRKPLVWTQKLITVVALAMLLYGLDFLLFAIILDWLGMRVPVVTTLVLGLGYVVAVYLFFVYLIAAVWLLKPIDKALKGRIIERARSALAAREEALTVIAITGSYGKTSMKAAIAAVLAERFSVLATPESVNTPLGVARFISDDVTPETEVVIVEMGAYQKGDIKALCEITPPDIAVLTGINEAHLERFGSLASTVAAKFEIVEHAKLDAFILLNADDARVFEEANEHTGSRHTVFYSAQGSEQAQYRAEAVRLNQDRPGIDFVLTGPNGRIGEFATPFLGRYVASLAAAAMAIGEHLKMETEEIKRGIEKLEPVKHRLTLASREGDIFVIDDSYNGNPDGVAEAIWTLGQFTSRRRIYVTPGLVEMGGKAEEVHRAIGRQLAPVADQVVLIRNSLTPYIAEGLREGGFFDEKIHYYATSSAMHAALPNTLKAGDVVLFQNDWPENYV